MALQVGHAGCHGLLGKLCVQLVVAGAEGYVHVAAGILCGYSLVEVLRIEVIVQHGGTLLSTLLHSLYAAHVFNPLGNQTEYIDAVRGRRVVHGILVSHGLPVQHNRVLLERIVAEQILADDDNGNTGRAHVLLCAGVDDAVLGNINRLGQDVGGHIRYQLNACRGLGIVLILGAVDGVVGADVEVVGIRTDIQLILRRNVVEVGLLGGECSVHVAELLCFLVSLGSEAAGQCVVSLAGLQQVHRDRCKLGGSAALQEQNLVVIRNGEYAAQRSLGLLDDAVIYL